MFCRKCGSQVPTESLFCLKCGAKIETAEQPTDREEASVSNISELCNPVEDMSNDSKNSFHFNGFSKKHKMVITAGLLLIFIVVFFVFNQFQYSKAKELFSSGDYYKAGKIADSVVSLGSDDVLDEIRFSGKVGAYYKYYRSDMGLEYSRTTVDYKGALGNLLDGIERCSVHTGDAKSQGEKKALENFSSKYNLALKSIFEISEEDGLALNKLSYEEKDKKISEIVSKKESEKRKEKYVSDNPIEFSNLAWDNNSSYMIATGSVTNISNHSVEFVTIKVLFKDRNNKVIDTDSTYAVGSEGLSPGESKKWRASVDKDSNISSFYVEVLSFE